MAGSKTPKNVVARCRDCGATSQETFLERIKGSKQYVCDECAADQAFHFQAYRSKAYKFSDDDEFENDYKPSKKKGKTRYHSFDDDLSDDLLFI